MLPFILAHDALKKGDIQKEITNALNPVVDALKPLGVSVPDLSGTLGDLNKKLVDLNSKISSDIPGFPDVVTPITDAVNQLKDLVIGFEKCISDTMDFLKKLDPEKLVQDLSELVKVIAPFSCIVPLLEMSAKAYDDIKDYSLDRELQAPNLNSDVAHELTRVLAVPVVGDMVRNQINLAWMDRYQHITGRGFPSALDQMRYLVSGGVTPASFISELESKAPDFFLNNDPDVSKFNKGYAAALKEKSLGKPLSRLPKL